MTGETHLHDRIMREGVRRAGCVEPEKQRDRGSRIDLLLCLPATTIGGDRAGCFTENLGTMFTSRWRIPAREAGQHGLNETDVSAGVCREASNRNAPSTPGRGCSLHPHILDVDVNAGMYVVEQIPSDVIRVLVNDEVIPAVPAPVRAKRPIP